MNDIEKDLTNWKFTLNNSLVSEEERAEANKRITDWKIAQEMFPKLKGEQDEADNRHTT